MSSKKTADHIKMNMKTNKLLLVGAVAALCQVGATNAASYVYDFSAMGFADGQVLEGMTLDAATFTSETSDLRYYTDYGAGIAAGFGAAGDIYIQFAAPVNGLSFRAGDGAGDNDAYAVTLYAFGTDALIGTFSTPVFGGINEPEWYTLNIAAGNVGRLVFDPGNGGVLPGTKEGLGGVIITDMSYNTTTGQVPDASSTLLLLGMAFTGLSVLRRKLS
jgi:hypothetical protein